MSFQFDFKKITYHSKKNNTIYIYYLCFYFIYNMKIAYTNLYSKKYQQSFYQITAGITCKYSIPQEIPLPLLPQHPDSFCSTHKNSNYSGLRSDRV